MATVRVYKNIAPPPLLGGPQGHMQYSVIVTASSKDEAASLAGVSARELEWERSTSWHVLQALDSAGLLAIPGQVYLTQATRGDTSLVHRKDGSGWELVGRLRYVPGSMVLDPV